MADILLEEVVEMVCSNEIPKIDGYYWVKRASHWSMEVIEYVGGVVYICGSRERFSPYYDVYFWGSRIEEEYL